MLETFMKKSRYKTNTNGGAAPVVVGVLAIVVFIAAVCFAALAPYFKSLPVYQSFIANYTVDLITVDSSLNSDGSFELTGKNSIQLDEKLTFSSSDTNVGIGNYDPHDYIYRDKGGENSNVTLLFTVETDKEVKDVFYNVVFCDEDGTNPVTVNQEEIVNNENGSITINKTTNIFVNKVTVNYKIRVKN